MTNIAVISDIHGNSEALTAVLNDIQKHNCEMILCAGDLVGYGPRPDEVIEMVKSQHIQTVMGNYDEAVGFKLPACGCHIEDSFQKNLMHNSLNWSIANTTSQSKEYLRSLPENLSIEVTGKKIFLTHASVDSISEYIYHSDEERISQVLEDLAEDIYIYGHTHLPFMQSHKNKIIINSGSVGRPKQGDIRSNYILLQISTKSVTVHFRCVAYDVEKVASDIVSFGLDPYFSNFLLNGGDSNNTLCDLPLSNN